MARTCPNCGRPALDDQSQFCNKCGSPFPQEQPKKILVRTTPRLADAIPQPVQPVQEYREQADPPLRSNAVSPPQPRPRIRAPPGKPARETGTTPPALTLLVTKRIRLVYWLGVIAIILIIVAGITTTKTTASTGAVADPSADAATKAATDLLAGIPLFWIGSFLFAVLLWRAVCEICALQAAHYNSLAAAGSVRSLAQVSLREDDALPNSEADEFTECPRCGKVVPQSELRSCSHCGVQGCSSCIRMMGLLKKTLTCRDCYQSKK